MKAATGVRILVHAQWCRGQCQVAGAILGCRLPCTYLGRLHVACVCHADAATAAAAGPWRPSTIIIIIIVGDLAPFASVLLSLVPMKRMRS